MSISDYYFARKLTGIGDLHFLKVLQQADSSGGGEGLLGSVVQDLHDGIWPFRVDYPSPSQMDEPGLVLAFMNQRRTLIGFAPSEPLTLSETLGPDAQTVNIERDEGGGITAGPFPGLPVSLGVQIDYSNIAQLQLSFGQGSQLKYVPLAYLARLYQYVGGYDTDIEPTGIIGRNYVVTAVLLARQFKVAFTARDDFTAQFKATVQNFVPPVQGSVTYQFKDDRTLEASVDGNTLYLAALEARRWGAFDHI